jgi:polar amino acid transport system permease protein
VFDVSLARESLGPLLHGLLVTVEYTFVVIILCLVAGVPVALARMSRHRALRIPVGAYVEIFRSTPLLIQLVYIYFALPPMGLKLSPFVAGVLGLTLHYTAFISEVYRSGFQAVPKGQTDAARALGMRERVVTLRIILPQAVRLVIPSLGNYFVSLIKDTSLLSVIAVQELLFSGQLIAARTFDYFTLYTMVFVIYLIVGGLAILAVRRIEKAAANKPGAKRRRRKPSAQASTASNAAGVA